MASAVLLYRPWVGSSWLNQPDEAWFGIITREPIRRATFTSVKALIWSERCVDGGQYHGGI